MRVIKYYLFLLLVFGYLKTNAQKEQEQSYFPMVKGSNKTLTWYNLKYKEVVGDTVNLKGKVYHEISQVFPKRNDIKIYLRKSNDTIYFFNKRLDKEIIFFGISPVKGEKIGNGTIKNVNVELNTPIGKLEELLHIEMIYPNGANDNRYYKKGLGLVAVRNKKGLISYLIPDNNSMD